VNDYNDSLSSVTVIKGSTKFAEALGAN